MRPISQRFTNFTRHRLGRRGRLNRPDPNNESEKNSPPITLFSMPRMARAGAVDCAYHITQRGNAKQAVFISPVLCDAELDLLKEHSDRFGLGVLAYCPMTNHVHIVGVPEDEEPMAWTFRHVNARFAQTWNTLARRSGHLWQNSFYSCPRESLKESLGHTSFYNCIDRFGRWHTQ